MPETEATAPLAAEVLALLAQRPVKGDPRLICIDGPAGSGKTTLAAEIWSAVPGAQVVHLDDLYEGWEDGLDAGLADRLRRLLLEPLLAGQPLLLPRYDWAAGGFGPALEVPATSLLVVEGVGSGQRGLRGRADLLVFLEVDVATGYDRVAARDGAAVASHLVAWQAAEQAHFEREGTRAAADLLVGTGG